MANIHKVLAWHLRVIRIYLYSSLFLYTKPLLQAGKYVPLNFTLSYMIHLEDSCLYPPLETLPLSQNTKLSLSINSFVSLNKVKLIYPSGFLAFKFCFVLWIFFYFRVFSKFQTESTCSMFPTMLSTLPDTGKLSKAGCKKKSRVFLPGDVCVIFEPIGLETNIATHSGHTALWSCLGYCTGT